ncbi:MAG TPA: ATP-binding protein [Acidimicrobiales bacterium]|nr:ATP-binding protein [Acidimicrobiales bacterium]
MVVLAVLAVALGVAVVVLAHRVRVLAGEAARRAEAERAAATARSRAAAADDVATRLREALDAVPQGVIVADVQERVVARNAAATELEEARHGEALVGGAVDELLAAALRGTPGERTLELFGPPHRVVVVTARPLPGGALVVTDDVTEARRLEAVRRDFVANLSHELKTPVGAIGLLAETLLGEADRAVADRLVERIVSESFRVSRTIDDLLELSRIEARGEVVRQPVALHLVLAEAADRMRPAAEQRDITIDVGDVAPRVSAAGDRRQLVSAVANLLDNAVKYSHPGSAVEVRAASDGTTVTVDVTDHGLGIPARDLERVFERFYRVDRARSRDTGGTGLGLAIVRHVVANHEGEVTVRSVEGQGSTFTLHLPAGPGPVALADTQAEAGARPAPDVPRRSA